MNLMLPLFVRDYGLAVLLLVGVLHAKRAGPATLSLGSPIDCMVSKEFDTDTVDNSN